MHSGNQPTPQLVFTYRSGQNPNKGIATPDDPEFPRRDNKFYFPQYFFDLHQVPVQYKTH
jgi:hypothetical protein